QTCALPILRIVGSRRDRLSALARSRAGGDGLPGTGGSGPGASPRGALWPLFAVVAGPDPAVADLNREPGHRLVGRRAQRASVTHVEAGAVQHALHAALGRIDLSRRQLEVLVAAAVLERVQVAVEVDHHDAGA